MGLFTPSQLDEINKVAARSKEAFVRPNAPKSKSITNDLNRISSIVTEYFKDSKAELITSVDQLHSYIDRCIEYGYAGIDTETTGLDRINDTIVGVSLYVPGMVEVYIPIKHKVPIFNELYKGQLTYDQVASELKRLVDAKVKLIFANADFDLAMIYKDLKVDLCDVCYYDVILAWRVLKENELHNDLKTLYNKYPLKGKGDPKRFKDFFPVELFPYCKPEIAKLYAANDAKITFELFEWQLPYVTKSNSKCQKAHLEAVADVVWGIEMPMIKVCQQMHRTGMYIDNTVASALQARYNELYQSEISKLQDMVQSILNTTTISYTSKKPFSYGKDFNPSSPTHVKYLCYTLLKLGDGKSTSTDKDILREFNLPVTDQILKVRSLKVLISTFVDKLPKATTADNRIHAQFKSVGADCIVKDSILPTSEGYKCIGDICESAGCKEAEHVSIDNLIVVNKDQISEEASSVIRYTDYPTIKITTEYGFTLEGTYNHPIMVGSTDSLYADDEVFQPSDIRYFKQLEDVSLGDIVEIPCNYWIGPSNYVEVGLKSSSEYLTSYKDLIVPKFYDEDVGELLGMYHSHIFNYFKDNNCTISTFNNIDVMKRVDELLLKLFNVTLIDCKQLDNIICSTIDSCNNSRVPNVIWSSPKSVINSYIKGLTLDSTVYFDESGRATIELDIENELDANLIQYHLASQGILCNKSVYTSEYGSKIFKLSINEDNYTLFRDLIGFIESEKYIYNGNYNCHTNTKVRIKDSFWLKVKKVEYMTNTVYDLHVPGTHSFISNGFISHNTGRMSSADPNLQNIPSHATDIRHMFRATAANHDIINCCLDNGDLYVTLPNVYQLHTPEGRSAAENLSKGDTIVVKHNNINIDAIVTNIVKVDAANLNIYFTPIEI